MKRRARKDTTACMRVEEERGLEGRERIRRMRDTKYINQEEWRTITNWTLRAKLGGYEAFCFL